MRCPKCGSDHFVCYRCSTKVEMQGLTGQLKDTPNPWKPFAIFLIICVIASLITLKVSMGNAQRQYDALKQQVQQTDQIREPSDKQRQASKRSSTDIVYVTETGACYHSEGCKYLEFSKFKTTRKKAKSEGYRACSICDP